MKVKLGEYIQEYSVRNKANEDIPVYSVTNTQGFCQDYFGKEVASKDKTTYKIVPRGYFAYNPSRINVGSVDWQRDEDQVIVSPLYNVFSVSPELNQQYLYYYLKSDFALHRIKAVATGSVRDNLKLEMLKNFPIRIPRVEEQEYIVQVLDKAKNIINLRRNELQKLDDLIKARFVEMFGDPDTNPKGWNECALSEKLNVVGGYAFKSDGFSEGSGIPVLRIGNINAGFFRPVNLVYWQEDESLDRYAMHPGDLVMSLTGTVGKDDYGNVCILGDDYDMYYLNQRNAKLEIIEGIDKFYLSQLLKFEQIKKKLTGISRGVRQANISNKDILNLVVPVPPMELQSQFADFIKQVDKSKATVQKALDETQLLFDSLMQQYFG